MKNVNNEDSQNEKPTRHRREKVVLTDEQIDAVIKDFQRGLNEYDHTGRKSDNKSKPSTSTQHASKSREPKTVEDFDVDSINTNILGMDDDSSSTEVDNVIKVNNDETSSSDGMSGIKERVLSQKAKMDELYFDIKTTSDNDNSIKDSEAATDTTIATNATITADVALVNNMVEVADSEVEPMKKNSESKNEPPPQTPQPATPKASRISAKMRKATRDEFHDAYLVKTDTKGGSPITIAPDVLQFAYRVCSLSGDHKARPTYLINNLLREIFKGLEADIQEWSKLD